MSTHGLFGFVVDGQVKAGYNHCDSYPGWLGQQAVDAINSGTLTIEAAKKISRW